jgi:hypothetical protein
LNIKAITYNVLSFVVALNYFVFRTELFKDEETQNHPLPSSTLSFSYPSLNWETFDKDNAPKAIVVDACSRIALIGLLPLQSHIVDQFHPSIHSVHDKSPPAALSAI